jgi:hypothetical protein
MYYRINEKTKAEVLKRSPRVKGWGGIPDEILDHRFKLEKNTEDDNHNTEDYEFILTKEECGKKITPRWPSKWYIKKEWIIADVSEKLDLI